MKLESIVDKLRGKRVGLALSAGFFGFYHQAGVLSTLVAAGISPIRVAGNSAGALVGGLYASGLNPDEIREVLLTLKRQDFWDMHVPFGPCGFSILAGRRFQAALGRHLAVHAFESCEVPFSVGVFDMDSGRMNYLESGSLIQAVYASSAVPYLFAPETIGGRRYFDGGFAEKTPMVPFLRHRDVDIVVVSYMPQRGSSKEQSGLRKFLPPLSAFFADVPYEERLERDMASYKALIEAGIEVLFLTPPRIYLGPFSIHKGKEAFDAGREGTERLLSSPVEAARPPWKERDTQQQ